jgi:hypothetical protein
MKRLIALIMAASFFTVAAFADAADMPAGGKNDCLLHTESCPDQQPTIQQYISMLKAEIAKGPAVYSKAELALLKSKLANAKALLNQLEEN